MIPRKRSIALAVAQASMTSAIAIYCTEPRPEQALIVSDPCHGKRGKKGKTKKDWQR